MPYQKRLGPLDLSFLAAETRESMMHVGALMQFTVPEGGGHEDFLVHLMDEIKRDATSLAEFIQAVERRPEVQDCFATTGQSDYHLRVLCRDLEAYNRFLEDFLFRLPAVASAQTNVVLRTLKRGGPVSV